VALHVRIRKTRPRVCLSEDSLPEIKHRIETTHVEEWSQLVVWSRGIAKTPHEYRLRPERLAERGKRLAFMYAIRHDPKDLEFALEVVPRLAEAAPTPLKVEALAQLYDSLNAALPEKLAATVRESLSAGARKLFDTNVKGAPVLAPGRSESVTAVFAAGISLFGDSDHAQELLGEAVHASRDLTGTLMYFLEEDGGVPLGWSESFVHLGQLPKLALLAESGLGQNWPREAPWLERYVEFLEAGMRRVDPAVKEGPFWAGGGATVRRLDLWRVLATVAAYTGNASAKRLLAAIPLRGCQDERVLYEVRDREVPEGKGTEAGPPGRRKMVFYRRAGLALFRDGPEDNPTEVVVRCPHALFVDRTRDIAGSFSIAGEADFVIARGETPAAFVIGGSADGERADGAPTFPRTRREINQSEHRRAEVLVCESLGDACDWMMVDLSRGHRLDADSVTRTFAFLRSTDAWRHPALIVYDEVRLKTPGNDAATVMHFAGKPEVMESALRCDAPSSRLWSQVLLPSPSQLWLDELLSSKNAQNGASSVWRLRIGSKDTGSKNVFCQTFMTDAAEADAPPGAVLLSSGASIVQVAGRVVAFAQETTTQIEGITAGEASQLIVVGVAPSVDARLETAGGDTLDTSASDMGGVHFPVSIPAGTGWRVSLRPPVGSDGAKRISMRRRRAGDTSAKIKKDVRDAKGKKEKKEEKKHKKEKEKGKEDKKDIDDTSDTEQKKDEEKTS